MVMTGSIPAEFHGARLSVVTTLVCDAQHENIDFAGDMPGRPALARRSFIRAATSNIARSNSASDRSDCAFATTSAAVCLLSIPATTPVPSNARDDYGCYQHYGNSRCHDASICDTPRARHSKVYSSDSPPKRG